MKKLSSPFKLIKDSFKIFFKKENLRYFALVYIAVTIFQAPSYFQGYFVNTNSTDFKFTPLIGIVFVIGILNFVVYILTSIAGIFAVKNVVAGKTLDFRSTAIFAWKNGWRFFLLIVLVFLATFGGLILLIIPGIIFGIWFAFAGFIFVDKGLGIKASMGRSRELVKNRFWQVFYRLLVFGLFSGLVNVAASAVPFGVGSVVVTLAGALFILPSYLLYKELE
jgi:hypothetical protein